MAFAVAARPAIRNRLANLFGFSGLISFDPGTKEFLVHRIPLKEKPEGSNFIPLDGDPGVYHLGVIHLKDQNGVEPGFYQVLPRDLYRRRIDARPSNRISRDQALGLLGADPAEFTTERRQPISAADGEMSGTDVEAEELRAADLLVQEQVGTLQHLEDSKAS